MKEIQLGNLLSNMLIAMVMHDGDDHDDDDGEDRVVNVAQSI